MINDFFVKRLAQMFSFDRRSFAKMPDLKRRKIGQEIETTPMIFNKKRVLGSLTSLDLEHFLATYGAASEYENQLRQNANAMTQKRRA